MKKKFCAVLTALLLVLLLSIPAFADVGAPTFLEYEATVTNQNGIDLYDGTHLAYGTVVTVTGEYDDEVYFSYNDSFGYTESSNLAALQSSLPETDGKKMYHPVTFEVMEEQGLDVKGGPAGAYDVTGHLEKGTVFTAEYGSSEAVEGYDVTYVYAKGYGWVDVSDTAAAIVVDGYSVYSGTVTTTEPLNIYSLPNTYIGEGYANTVVAAIPAGEAVTFRLMTSDISDAYAYVEWNGSNGWILLSRSGITGGINDVYMAITAIYTEGVPLYSEPFNQGSKLDVVLPAGEMTYAEKQIGREAAGSEDSWMIPVDSSYYVCVNGIYGWVTSTDANRTLLVNSNYSYTFTVSASVSLYDEPSGSVIATIPAGASGTYYQYLYLEDSNSSYYYVEYNGAYGLVEYDYAQLESNPSDRTYVTRPVEEDIAADDTDTENGNGTVPSTNKPAGGTTGNGSKTSASTVIIVCVIVVVVLAASAAAAVVYLKKKKQ